MSKRKPTDEGISAETSSAISVRNYPSQLCRRRPSKDGESFFNSVSFQYNGKWGSFVMNDDELSPSTRRNGDQIPDRLDLMLGDEDDIRFVSLKSGDHYVRQPMFNRTIRNSIVAGRKEYLRSIAV